MDKADAGQLTCMRRARGRRVLTRGYTGGLDTLVEGARGEGEPPGMADLWGELGLECRVEAGEGVEGDRRLFRAGERPEQAHVAAARAEGGVAELTGPLQRAREPTWDKSLREPSAQKKNGSKGGTFILMKGKNTQL